MNVRIKSTALLCLAFTAVFLPGIARAQTGGTTTPPDPVAKADGTAPTEQKFSLDLRNAPLRDALERLFRQAKLDFSLDNSVQGTVTLKVTDQPLETILRLLIRSASAPLTFSKEGGVYFIKLRQTSQPAAGPGETRSPGGSGSGERTLVADQDGNRLIALADDTFAGVRPLDVIQLTYLDPADIAQLFRIIQIPSFSRQGGAGGAGGVGAGVGGPGAGGPSVGSGPGIGGPGAGSGNPGPRR